MKNDLATAIITAVLGFVIAYLICNMVILQPLEPAKVKTLETSASADLDEPNIDAFNYRALNPTVEVYVGDCKEFNEYGECIDGKNSNSGNSNSSSTTDNTDTNQETE